jgi:hypothetical protein
MPRLAISLYFLGSYSIGLLALFLGFMQYLKCRSPSFLYFLLTTLSYTLIVITSTLMNLVEIPAASIGRQAFTLANYLSASALVYLLPSFARRIFTAGVERGGLGPALCDSPAIDSREGYPGKKGRTRN